jgi:hypothetical protein
MPNDLTAIRESARAATVDDEYGEDTTGYRPYDGGPALGIFTAFLLAGTFWGVGASLFWWWATN